MSSRTSGPDFGRQGIIMELLYIVGAAVATGFIVWMLMRNRADAAVAEAHREVSIIQAGFDAKEEAFLNASNDAEFRMKDAFKVLAQETLDEIVKKAEDNKESSFKVATSDLSEQLKGYIAKMEEVQLGHVSRSASLEQRISEVANLGLNLSEETKNLTRALKSDSQAQGAWGELVLENLLQSLGFKEGVEYYKQESFTQADRSRKVTDFIINLPDERQVIIDSKVSLTAWDKFVNAEDDEESEAAMKEHVTSVNNHVKTLANKNYQDIEQVNTVDFVLMFVPLEPAFGAAMRMRPDLYQEFAENNRVKIVTGGTIVIALMLIQDIWKRERQSGNQVKLIDEAGKLHDKIVLFLESFKQLGHEIDQASVAYDEAMNRLSVGSGNVIKRTNDLKLLGAKVKKEINTQLLSEGQINHDMAGETSD